VVLTPQQALSTADDALLRILRGLNKDRIVVFLNRIDQLGDLVRDVPIIMRHVREGLRRELPGSELPVVAGSAFWADTALRGLDGETERAWSASTGHARHLGRGTATRSSALGTRSSAQATRAIQCPGPADARCQIDILSRVSRSFCDLARVAENAARHSSLSSRKMKPRSAAMTS
jgi:hypothetical protein